MEINLIRKILTASKKLQNKAISHLADGWMLDQQIPLQSIYRSRFEYDIHEFGRHELYAPKLGAQNPANNLKDLRHHYLPQSLPKPYYFHIKNAGVFNRQIVDPENPKRVILESFPEGSMQDEGRNFRPELLIRRKIRKHAATKQIDINEGYLFSSFWWKNYYHFLIDACLRFNELQSQGAFTKNTTLLLHSDPKPWQRGYLNLLGLEDHETEMTYHKPLNVKRLLIGSPRRHRFPVSMDAIDSFKNRMFERLDISGAAPKRRIFITRKGAKVRRIINEEEVESFLIAEGFELIASEKYTVDDQIRLFSEAETIVAPHGAGLANMIYSNRPKIIELFPADRWNIGYFLALTNSIGGTHVPIISAPQNDTDDFCVDIPKLSAALQISGQFSNLNT